MDINLDRPTVMPEINAKAKGVLADFGVRDAAVRKQKEDAPHDSKNPLYKFGYGLSYE